MLEKTNDPVRMYLREMGTVPLLTREGEVAIAKRIERGQLLVLKTITHSPIILKEILNIVVITHVHNLRRNSLRPHDSFLRRLPPDILACEFLQQIIIQGHQCCLPLPDMPSLSRLTNCPFTVLSISQPAMFR
jgi:hypothetical protein